MRASISFVPLSRQIAVLTLLLFVATVVYAQITSSQDAYTNSADPTTNYGTAVTLGVVNTTASIQTTYIQFDLSSIPAGYTSSNIAKATLKLYVNTVTTAGSFNIDFVNGTWTEKKITSSLAPALGTTIVSSVPLTSANAKGYLLLDITSAVGAWLNGTQPNDGIALVGNSPLSTTFDSKENTLQSQPPEIDMVFAGGGTITGVTTASGSGLTGGGTSGTLNLSLLTSCASGQVLQWSGSAWACASAGTGTITGVIAGTDLTGGGTSGKVTLNLNLSKVPQLGTANTFTGNQTVNGNLSATGLVTGTAFNIGSNLFAFGSWANANAFLGFAGNATMTGVGNTASGEHAFLSNTTGSQNTASGQAALYSNTTGSQNTASGYSALYSNTTGNQNTASGYWALLSNTTGSQNTASGYQALFSDTTGSNNTAAGFQALYNNTTGVSNVAVGYQALASITTGNTGGWNTASGANALEDNTTGNYNAATGASALEVNTTGSGNAANGVLALDHNTTGQNNTAVGYFALSTNQTGSDLTCIGYNCGVSVDGLTNATAIGVFAAVGESNALVLGGTGTYAVKVGIGTATPSNVLTIAQGAGQAIADGWTTYSSRRWKTNIHTLHDALAKVEQLRGVSYDLKANGQHEVGVIAEEVGAVVPEVVTWEKNGKDAQSVDYGRLTALLIEATKEQQAVIREQQEQIKVQQMQIQAERKRGDAQQARIARLTSQVEAIQASLKTNSGADSEVRAVKAEGATVRQ